MLEYFKANEAHHLIFIIMQTSNIPYSKSSVKNYLKKLKTNNLPRLGQLVFSIKQKVAMTFVTETF